jgi:hypothetical protein
MAIRTTNCPPETLIERRITQFARGIYGSKTYLATYKLSSGLLRAYLEQIRWEFGAIRFLTLVRKSITENPLLLSSENDYGHYGSRESRFWFGGSILVLWHPLLSCNGFTLQSQSCQKIYGCWLIKISALIDLLFQFLRESGIES